MTQQIGQANAVGLPQVNQGAPVLPVNQGATSSKCWACFSAVLWAVKTLTVTAPLTILSSPLILTETVSAIQNGMANKVNAVKNGASQTLASIANSRSFQGVGLLCSWGTTLATTLTTLGGLALQVTPSLASWSFKTVVACTYTAIKSTGDLVVYKALDKVTPDVVPLRSYTLSTISYLTSIYLWTHVLFEPAKDILKTASSGLARATIGAATSSLVANEVSDWTSYGVSAAVNLPSNFNLKEIPAVAFGLLGQAASTTGNTVLKEAVSAAGELAQVAVNAAENPMGTAWGVSLWGFNMFSKIGGYAASNWRSIASAAVSVEGITLVGMAALCYLSIPAEPGPRWLPAFAKNFRHKKIPGPIQKSLSYGLNCLSLGLEYIPGSKYISAYVNKAPKPPVEICVSQYNQEQITQSIDGLKEGHPQHLLLIEPQGSEREKIVQNILGQSECNYIRLDAANIAWLIDYSVNSSTSSSTDKKNAIHLALLEEIKQLKHSPLPTILHIQGLESLRSKAPSNSYGNRDSENKTDAVSNAYEEVLSALKQIMKDEKRLMIIGETTHPSQIDSDFKHAMRAIQIDLPDYETRVKILRRAINEELANIPEKESCLNEEAIATIAKRTPGLNSDLLERLINDLTYQRRWEPNRRLTEESVKKATNQAIVSYYRQLEGKKPKLADKFHPFNVPVLEGEDKKDKKPSPPPVFNKQLQAQIGDIVKWTKNILANQGDMQNLLLYGEAGTGKTMVAEKIAKESGFNYISINGGDLAQFIQEGTHLTELNNLFAFIDDATEPTILFIDEMDVFAAKRNTLDQPRREILNAFLARTGTPSSKLMIIGTTNCMETMDSAVLSRMSNKLHIAPPELASRLSILTNIIDEKMGDIPERKDSLNDESIKLLARRTDGMAGRTLRALVTKLQAKRDTTEDRKLTVDMVQDVTYATVLEERAVTGKSSRWFWDFWYFTLPSVKRAVSRALSSCTPGFLTSKVT